MAPNRARVSSQLEARAERSAAAGDASLSEHPRRGDAGRNASSARAHRYVRALEPILELCADRVGRTPYALALELTRTAIRKPRGGTIWTPVEVGKLMQRLARATDRPE